MTNKVEVWFGVIRSNWELHEFGLVESSLVWLISVG